MQITHTEIYRFSIPMEPFTIATGTMDYAQNVFVRIYTDADIYGVGECSAFPYITGETQETCLAMARDFARLWKGHNPLNIEKRLKQLNDFTAGNTTIKSAFDMALYDIAAKHAGLPLYRYLGGKKRSVETDITIGLNKPETMAAKALEFVDKGANTLKVKLGMGADDDILRIKMIRDAVGYDVKLRIDANQGWSFDDAVTALVGMEPFDIEFCEQPMRTWYNDRLPALKKLSPIKLMADESVYNHHDARMQINARACDYVNIKFAKTGGIFEATKINEVTANEGIACMMGGMLESRIALTAQLHFVYASPNIQFFDMDTPLLGHKTDPCIGGAQYDGFYLDMPEATGIGADAHDDFLKNCDKWVI